MTSSQANRPLVSATWLKEQLSTSNDLRLVDTRWYLDGRQGKTIYQAGHLPGAVYADMESDLSGEKRLPWGGRHPLPEPTDFAHVLVKLGIGPLTHVVAYDDDGGSRAARLWWMMKYYGHTGGCSLLDGGIQAWEASGGQLETGEVTVEPAREQHLIPNRALIVEASTLRHNQELILIDARSADRYAGQFEPVDARPGHIPRAKNMPYSKNLANDKTFLPSAELRTLYEKIGANQGDKAVVYCGSGVTACHNLIAMELAGWQGVRLYPGSYSEWSRLEEMSVETTTDTDTDEKAP
jgi:thiosulfate/3-mercaptopyruvate sulfurtransferase